ncbi:MAG: hypothetical protein JRH01_19145 [Deltaproteobacteria bacterium]|nr:hypothetical protein [Deltaproteobacteria bacterium]MBW2397070.1 hypothetical protein [Deltaproteobacteria bacterium]
MKFDLIPILSTIIMATTIVTIILAFGSYAAYKLRDRQRARVGRVAADEEAPPPVFRRYQRGNGRDSAVDGEDSGR